MFYELNTDHINIVIVFIISVLLLWQHRFHYHSSILLWNVTIMECILIQEKFKDDNFMENSLSQ